MVQKPPMIDRIGATIASAMPPTSASFIAVSAMPGLASAQPIRLCTTCVAVRAISVIVGRSMVPSVMLRPSSAEANSVRAPRRLLPISAATCAARPPEPDSCAT